MRALSASSPLPRVTSRRWVERCWPTIRQARRCDTWKRSCNMTTALRRATGSEVSPGDRSARRSRDAWRPRRQPCPLREADSASRNFRTTWSGVCFRIFTALILLLPRSIKTLIRGGPISGCPATDLTQNLRSHEEADPAELCQCGSRLDHLGRRSASRRLRPCRSTSRSL